MSSEQVNEEDSASASLDIEEKDNETNISLEDESEKNSEKDDSENISQISENEQSEHNLIEETDEEQLPGDGDNVKEEKSVIDIDENQIQQKSEQDFTQGKTNDVFQNTGEQDDKTDIEKLEKVAEKKSDSSIKSTDELKKTDVDEEKIHSGTSVKEEELSILKSDQSLQASIETRRFSSLLISDQGHNSDEQPVQFDLAPGDFVADSNKSFESFKSDDQATGDQILTNLSLYVNKLSNLNKRISAEEEQSDKDTEKTLIKVDVQELISGYKTEDKLMIDSLNVISGLESIRQDLISIKDEPILLRKDYKSYKGVRILSGGHMGHEPLFAEYVGKGMLTGVVLGSVCDPPSVAAVIKAMQELATHSPGLLIIILNSVEYRLIFSLAIEYLKMEGYSNIEMVVAADDCYESCRSPVGRRGLAGIILLYKLAGSMADSDKTLHEIFLKVSSASKTIKTISSVTKPCKIIGCGMAKNAKDGINFNGDHTQMIRHMLEYCLSPNKNLSIKLDPNDSLIVLINNYRSLSPEFYIIVDRVLKELESRNVKISRVYANNFITGYRPGFSITLMTDVNDNRIKYLDTPTSVSLWTKNPSNGSLSIHKLSYENKKNQEMGPIITNQDKKILKTALVSACKTIILCETELNMMHFFGNYGSKLKRSAETVLKACKQSLINFSRPFNLLIDLSEIVVESLPGATGAMYGCLFEGAARSFLRNDLTIVTNRSWIEAMDAALTTFKAYSNAKEGVVSLTFLLIPKLKSTGSPFSTLKHARRIILNILEPLRHKIKNRIKQSENTNSQYKLQNELNIDLYAIIIWLHAIYSSFYWAYPSVRDSNEAEYINQDSTDFFKKSIDTTGKKSDITIKTERLRKSSSFDSTRMYKSISSKNEFSVSPKQSFKEGIDEYDFITEELEDAEEFSHLDDQILTGYTVDDEEELFFTDISEATEEQSFIPT